MPCVRALRAIKDDGDFAILGVNVEEATDGDASDGQIVGLDLLSSTMSAGVSANAGGGDTSLSDAFVGRLLQDNTLLSNDANDDATNEGGISKPLEAHAAGGAIDEEDEESLKAWLLEVIPKLNRHDLGAYARGLSGIGFHPECVTMCELKVDDLDFMKVLHRRYLFNEVTGIEHPWEV